MGQDRPPLGDDGALIANRIGNVIKAAISMDMDPVVVLAIGLRVHADFMRAFCIDDTKAREALILAIDDALQLPLNAPMQQLADALRKAEAPAG